MRAQRTDQHLGKSPTNQFEMIGSEVFVRTNDGPMLVKIIDTVIVANPKVNSKDHQQIAVTGYLVEDYQHRMLGVVSPHDLIRIYDSERDSCEIVVIKQGQERSEGKYKTVDEALKFVVNFGTNELRRIGLGKNELEWLIIRGRKKYKRWDYDQKEWVDVIE